MKKTIEIDGKTVPFKANALTALIYRRDFQKDLFAELRNIDLKEMSVATMQTIYELAYVMAKQGDKSLKLNFSEWLENFEVFPIEEIGLEVLTLWQKSNTGLSSSKNR